MAVFSTLLKQMSRPCHQSGSIPYVPIGGLMRLERTDLVSWVAQAEKRTAMAGMQKHPFHGISPAGN
ncbi:hypothetical protein [Geobacter sp. SVR]|uniref:hypothetical protein n=1 Tax=Geobacter sp. SVR TaxID=2495594 RepID=UPI001565DD95|nr:hypothetical protein [Geobacter sp. SVR]